MQLKSAVVGMMAGMALTLSTFSIGQPLGNWGGLNRIDNSVADMNGQGPIATAIQEFAADLNLSDEQKAEIADIILYAQGVRADHLDVALSLIGEAQAAFEAGDPDVAVLSLMVEASVDQQIEQSRTVRDRWLDFYQNSLSEQQQAVIDEAVLNKLNRLERLLNWATAFRN
ncbi:MAG: hypothetical protein ACFCBW_22645 [Candidatus Competibacterales bacterium]